LAEISKDITVVDGFSGLVDSYNPDLVPAGAMVNQVNLVCIKQNLLEVRQGYLKVEFEDS